MLSYSLPLRSYPPLPLLLTIGVIIIAVNLLTPAFYYIPMASLAALIQSAVLSSLDFQSYIDAYSLPTQVGRWKGEEEEEEEDYCSWW